MSLSGPRALYLLLLPLVYLLLQPLQEPVLPAQLGQQSLDKREWELFVGQIWLFPYFLFPPPHHLEYSLSNSENSAGVGSGVTYICLQALVKG